MKQIIIALSLVVSIVITGFTLVWLWSDKDQNNKLSVIIAQEKSKQINAAGNFTALDAEISAGKTGLTIETLAGQKLDARITDQPVKNAEVYDGVLTYSVQEDGQWNYRAIHLNQYAETFLAE